MLLQALHVKIEMKNQNLQVTLLVQKGVGTRYHAKNRCGNAVPTGSHPTTPLIMHEYASKLTTTPKAELFYSCKRRKLIGQNEVKINKLLSQNFNFLSQKISFPSYII